MEEEKDVLSYWDAFDPTVTREGWEEEMRARGFQKVRVLQSCEETEVCLASRTKRKSKKDSEGEIQKQCVLKWMRNSSGCLMETSCLYMQEKVGPRVYIFP